MRIKTDVPKKKILPMCLLLAAVLLLAVFVFLLHQYRTGLGTGRLERELTAEAGILPDMTEQEIQDRLNQRVAESMLNISMNPTPVFPDGRREGNVRIENIPGNRYSFTVEIVRSDSNEPVMKTGLIDPGHYVENRALDVQLPAGVYPCVATFTAYDSQTQQEIGSAGLQVVITVEK